jgi:hypothetical protein
VMVAELPGQRLLQDALLVRTDPRASSASTAGLRCPASSTSIEQS